MDNPHDYLITSRPPSRPVDPDNADSWVMLNQGGFVKLGNERVLMKLESRISCDLSVPQELRPRCTSFQRKSDKGTLFLTNKRVSSVLKRTRTQLIFSRSFIFLPNPPRNPNSNLSAHPS